MPWSFGDTEKRQALALVSGRNGIRGVVDLGAGAGLWRQLSREFVIGAVPWTAIEAYRPYIERFKLAERYTRVRNKDLRSIKYGQFPGHVFIFGDVLEHLPRADALNVMRRACSMGTVIVMMPFLPTISEEQDAVDGVEWERHRYVWHWEEWLAALRELGHEPDQVVVPPGDGRNKGITICWHPSHPVWDYWAPRAHLNYYRVAREYVEQLSPGASLMDVGSWNTPVVTWGRFERRYACDLAHVPEYPGVVSHVGDFLTWELPEHVSVATCLQTLEHLRDAVIMDFTAKLLASADALVVSVPYRWPAGQEPSHQQDPIDLAKLTRLMHGRKPAEHNVVKDGKLRRLVAVWR
jgi:hypothetical protein